ncbi:hypothetical protein [Stieleria mannarensis]|uniref:hypothetical protein n=1 Tax=Stieleria mannarensis TaxID=2755585 RepID=UPI0015FFD9EB|nr:hypothetical protein [Rhodopirellula sp. JC639]
MSRLFYSFMFVFGLSVISFTAVGCGESNTVIEDTRSEEEIQQELDDYEKQMEEESEELSE